LPVKPGVWSSLIVEAITHGQRLKWYARRELNPQPLAPEANALSN
jgi:hypothetical protein